MKFLTDDDIYRARLVWLGPPGYTLPIQLPYTQWVLFAVLTAAFSAILVPLTGNWASTGMAIAAAMLATYLIWQQVDPDRPALKVMFSVLLDLTQVKPAKEKTHRLSAGHIIVRPEITGGR